jgi:hypothetical protein
MDNAVLQKSRIEMRQKPVMTWNQLPLVLQTGKRQGSNAILAYIAERLSAP